MRKIDRVPREILHRVNSRGDRFITQSSLAESCDLSPGTINPVITRLEWVGAVVRRPQGFRVVDEKKLLTYWSVKRDLPGDIEYSTYVPERPSELMSDLPNSVLYTGYSGYRRYMGEVPGRYVEVHAYGDAKKIEKLFPPRRGENPNLFIFEPDDHLTGLSRRGVVPISQLQVDLWWLGKLGDRLLENLEEARMEGRLKRLTESMKRRLEKQALDARACSICGRTTSAGEAENLEAGGKEFVLCSDCKTSVFKPAAHTVRIWRELDLPPKVLEKAMEILGDARDENLISGRSPRGVAAGAICIASAVFGKDKSRKEIASTAGITPNTLRIRYKDLGRKLEIIPKEGEIP